MDWWIGGLVDWWIGGLVDWWIDGLVVWFVWDWVFVYRILLVWLMGRMVEMMQII